MSVDVEVKQYSAGTFVLVGGMVQRKMLHRYRYTVPTMREIKKYAPCIEDIEPKGLTVVYAKSSRSKITWRYTRKTGWSRWVSW